MAIIEERLNRLEKEAVKSRKEAVWYRRATLFLGLMIIAGATMGQIRTTHPGSPFMKKGKKDLAATNNKSDEFTIMRELKARGLPLPQIAAELRKRDSVLGQFLVTILGRLKALENHLESLAVSQPPATPATNQAGSTSGELTCTKLTVVNSAGQPKVILSAKDNGGQAIFRGPDSTTRIYLYMAPNSGGGALTLFKGGSTEMSGQGGQVTAEVTNNGGRITVIDNTGLGSGSCVINSGTCQVE